MQVGADDRVSPLLNTRLNLERMPMKFNAALLLCAALVCAPALAAPQATTSAMHGDHARPAEAAGWVKSELYFGLGEERGESSRQQTEHISEAQWREFLDREVTPRFPDGLTVLDAYGQWLFSDTGQLHRLRSKVVVIVHEDTAQQRNAIEAIRLAWKQATGHQSVLWASSPVRVSF